MRGNDGMRGYACAGTEAREGCALEQTGEYTVPAPRERVWEALNDPEVLQRCVEGCRSMAVTGDGEFEAVVAAKVGPVKATFTAAIELHDIVAPESYRLQVGVKGGAAGFAKGSAVVQLAECTGAETRLTYRIEGSIGGKLAQIGSRLVQAAARKMAASFFERFAVDIGRSQGV